MAGPPLSTQNEDIWDALQLELQVGLIDL